MSLFKTYTYSLLGSSIDYSYSNFESIPLGPTHFPYITKHFLLLKIVMVGRASSWEIPTMNITDILIGRCLFLNTLKQDAPTNCSQFINDLQSVWDNNRDTEIFTSDYDEYNLLENADFSSPRDRSLFWSGVPKKVVDDFSNKG